MQFGVAGSPLRLYTVIHRYEHLIHRVFHSSKRYLQRNFLAFPQIERAITLTTIFFTNHEMMNWVREILSHYNLADEFSDQELLLCWDEIVGPQLARMTRATRFSNGTLIVEVASSAVSQELDLLKQRYIDLLNERMKRDVLQRVRFVPGHFPAPRSIRVSDAEDVADDQLALSGIDDAQLRDSFGSLYRTQRRRERAMLRAGARRCPRCGVVFFGNDGICPGCQFDEIDGK